MFHLCATFPKMRKCLPGAPSLLESSFPAVSSEKKKSYVTPIPKPEWLELTRPSSQAQTTVFLGSEQHQSPICSQEIEER